MLRLTRKPGQRVRIGEGDDAVWVTPRRIAGVVVETFVEVEVEDDRGRRTAVVSTSRPLDLGGVRVYAAVPHLPAHVTDPHQFALAFDGPREVPIAREELIDAPPRGIDWRDE